MNLIVGSTKHTGVESFTLESKKGVRKTIRLTEREDGLAGISIEGFGKLDDQTVIEEFINMAIIFASMNVMANFARSEEVRELFMSLNPDNSDGLTKTETSFITSFFVQTRFMWDSLIREPDSENYSSLQFAARDGMEKYRRLKGILHAISPYDVKKALENLRDGT